MDSGKELGALKVVLIIFMTQVLTSPAKLQTWSRRLEEEELWYKICM